MFLVRICPTFSVDLFVHLLPPCSSGRSQIYTEVPVSQDTTSVIFVTPVKTHGCGAVTPLSEEAAGRSTLGQTAICFMSRGI